MEVFIKFLKKEVGNMSNRKFRISIQGNLNICAFAAFGFNGGSVSAELYDSPAFASVTLP